MQDMQETRVSSPGSGRSLEEEMATHSGILAWEIPGQKSQVGYSPWGHKELDTTEYIHTMSTSSC